MDAIEKKLRKDVEQFGWHVLNVAGTKDRPAHSYSVGLLATMQHPEIIVMGLPADRAQAFINNMGEEIRDGKVFEEDKRYDHLIEGYDVTFVRVAPRFYRDYFGRAIDYYQSADFTVLQMIWPDRNRAFPWEERCDPAIKKLQPVLTE